MIDIFRSPKGELALVEFWSVDPEQNTRAVCLGRDVAGFALMTHQLNHSPTLEFRLLDFSFFHQFSLEWLRGSYVPIPYISQPEQLSRADVQRPLAVFVQASSQIIDEFRALTFEFRFECLDHFQQRNSFFDAPASV